MRSLRSFAAIAAVSLFSSPVWANTGTADCDGWMMTSNYFAESVHITQVSLEVFQNGAWVPTGIVQYDSVWIDTPEIADTRTNFALGGTWPIVLDGSYRATFVNRRWVGSWGSELAALAAVDWDTQEGSHGQNVLPQLTFSCILPSSPRTPGYWKNHPEEWAGVTLQLGNELGDFDQDCLLQILAQQPQGDIRVKFLHHLIAAKLNVLDGSNPSIQSTINMADSILLTSDIGCLGLGGQRPTNVEKAVFESFKNELDAYNNGIL